MTNYANLCYTSTHMSTINISLPKQQASSVDSLIEKYGFANRSEFFRSLLRLIIHNENIIEQASVYPFIDPKTKSTAEIMSAFTDTKKYSKEFLHDLKEGLSESATFTK